MPISSAKQQELTAKWQAKMKQRALAKGAGGSSPAQSAHLTDSYEPQKEIPISVLGVGGQGGVLKVRNRNTGRISAFKIMCGQEKWVAKNEYQLMRRVHSPFISKPIGYGQFSVNQDFMIVMLQHFEDRDKSEDQDQFVKSWENDNGKCWSIQMELAKGLSLRKTRGVTKNDVEKIAQQMLLGIRDMHRAGIAHQDLKPHNVMYDPKAMHATIIDFGLACTDRCDPDLGTKEYFGPSRLAVRFGPKRKKKQWTLKQAQRDDLWAFGLIMLYVMSDDPKDDQLDEITDKAPLNAANGINPRTDLFRAVGKKLTYQDHLMRQLTVRLKNRASPQVFKAVRAALDVEGKPNLTVDELLKIVSRR